jgi:hypothetical protein
MKKALLIAAVLFSSLQLLKAQSNDTICLLSGDAQTLLLNVFPNPSEGTFRIIYASTTSCPPPGWGGELLINIINSNGKTVYSETILNFEDAYNRIIDLTAYEKGVYIIEIVAGKLKLVRRVVLN